MKKVLIISYFFPPNTTIVSSLRPYSWFLDFPKHGIIPTVITRHWSGKPIKNVGELLSEDLSEIIIEKDNGQEIYYLPFKKSILIKIYEKMEGNPFLKPIYLIYRMILGLFGIFTNEADTNYAFKNFAVELVKKNNYDLVISSAMPLSALKLLFHIHKETKVPVVIDFRDHWNNHLLNKSFKFTLRARAYFKVQEYYIKKWLKSMSGVISVNDSILEDLNHLRERNSIVIYNGFESDLFKNIQPAKGNKFRIIILGALYPTQDINFMIDGFKKFLNGKPESEAEILFIGLKYFEVLASHIQKELPETMVKITDRLPREEGLQLLLGSDVLYYIGWKGFRGMYSGKIFEYLGARKNILIAPSDEDVLEKLILETDSGKVAYSSNEMASTLNQWFEEWKQYGKLKYSGKEEKINNYTRSFQAEKLAGYINSLLNEK